ncbi:DMT family transporter [Streptomyces sp. NPDC013455]|uniref:DMT family transporter n=1 Tax=Streptomyces sp. NPDC013455 TaxID=3155605 RepID=UPI0033E8EF93
MSALALSVLLSVVSALAYAGGAIAQEQVSVSSPDSAYLPLRRPGWWGALALNGLGGVLHVVALAYGPLSLVQPLGALTIVFALPMAALCVGRRAGATAWRGALMATVGLAVLLSLVGSSAGHSLDPAQRLAVALVTGGAVVALAFAGLAAHRHPAVRSVLLATASGIAFGMASVFTKTVAVDWGGGTGLAALSSLAAIGVFAAAGVLLSQAAYRGGGLAAPLATLTVVNPVLAAVVGILMFGEVFRYGTTGTVLALACGVVTAGGLIMLTTERLEQEVPGPAAEPAERTPAAPDPAGPAPAVLGLAVQDLAVPDVVVPDVVVPDVVVPDTAVPEPAVPAAAVPAANGPVSPSPGPSAEAPTASTVPTPPGTPTAATAAHALSDMRPGVPQQRQAVEDAVGRAAFAEADEEVLRELLAPGRVGGGADAGRGEPRAAAVLPASYTPLPVGVHVPLPVLHRRRTRVRS